MYSVEDHNFCPHCLKNKFESTLRFVRYGIFTFLRCDDPYCPYNLEGHHLVNKPAEAPLSKSHVRQLGAPMSLLKEPLAKRKHLNLLAWMKKMKTGIYGWLGVEVQKMIENKLRPSKGAQQSAVELSRYKLSSEIKLLLKLSRAEIQVCKYIIPDLDLIVRIAYNAYEKYVKDKEPTKFKRSMASLRMN